MNRVPTKNFAGNTESIRAISYYDWESVVVTQILGALCKWLKLRIFKCKWHIILKITKKFYSKISSRSIYAFEKVVLKMFPVLTVVEFSVFW